MSKEQEIIKRLKFYIENGVGSPLNIEDYKVIIQALEDLKLYKQAFEIMTDQFKFFNYKEIRRQALDLARKELENERKI